MPFPDPPTLGRMRLHETGMIARLSDEAMTTTSLSFRELEKRLLEMGFHEGARVRLIHTAPFGDPIIVQVEDSRIALRRNEANAVWLKPVPEPS